MFVVAAALAAAVAAVISLSYQRDIRAARARVAEGGRVVDTACGRIQYAEAGAGAPLLMVHGAGGGYDQGLEFSGGLAERGFRVVAVSRFGYLATPLPEDASAAAQADAHACLMDALGIERAVVLGGSAGAPSSVQLALRHPDRVDALVLLVPALYVPREEGAPAVTPPPGLELVFGTALRFDFLFWAAINVSPGMLVRTVLGTDPSLVHQANAAEQARVGRMLETILPISARRLGVDRAGDSGSLKSGRRAVPDGAGDL